LLEHNAHPFPESGDSSFNHHFRGINVDKKYRIFTINPGSTSTKIALFENDTEIFSVNVSHDATRLKAFREISDQLPYRKETILGELARKRISLEGIDAFVGRGGGLVGLEGGTYPINEILLHHARIGFTVKHPATLGSQLAHDFAATYGGKAFVVNPPDVDEFDLIARVSGLRDVSRESRGHPLNQKEVGIRYARGVGKRYEDLNLIISHIGGGITVTAHRKGLMVDSTDVINGDGPMAPTRAGAIPATAIIRMCYSGKYSEAQMYDRITKNGGLVDHLGTADVREIHERIKTGDGYAQLIYDAMIYQIAKSIGAYATVLKGRVDAILLTGGVVHDGYLVEKITDRVSYIAPVRVYAGEFEMEAMAAGALRVLIGLEQPKTYTGVPVWSGFEK
jgi:butyrate kinase